MPHRTDRFRRMAGLGAAAPPTAVPVTVRTVTRDGAQIRLLLDIHVTPGRGTDEAGVERVTLAVVAPATDAWVRRHLLADLEPRLPQLRTALEEAARPVLTGLDVDLSAVDVVAIEHLLVSPSTDPPPAPLD